MLLRDGRFRAADRPKARCAACALTAECSAAHSAARAVELAQLATILLTVSTHKRAGKAARLSERRPTEYAEY